MTNVNLNMSAELQGLEAAERRARSCHCGVASWHELPRGPWPEKGCAE